MRNKTTIIWITILAVLASPVAFLILPFFLAMLTNDTSYDHFCGHGDYLSSYSCLSH
ncbi:protein of unknown function [Streptococcus thermophilus]|uniref:Uncharacterized protein n=1 Tax=Streptococcus thermophilus TaxID=1308 RepID=A0A8D6U5B4_STRTR|nr:protein of unknown function [Streptococcus thermophilus]